MAIDTRNKRASAIGIALAFVAILPNPDSTIDQADRQQTAYSYSGILAAGAADPVEVAKLVGAALLDDPDSLSVPKIVGAALLDDTELDRVVIPKMVAYALLDPPGAHGVGNLIVDAATIAGTGFAISPDCAILENMSDTDLELSEEMTADMTFSEETTEDIALLERMPTQDLEIAEEMTEDLVFSLLLDPCAESLI